MSYFLQNGDVFTPTPSKDSVLETLPPGNYVVIKTMTGLMFRRADSFTEPGRMYGNINDRAERIMNTFLDRPRTTGVLLSGEKGSGKSQLARNIAYAGYEQGIPTILVNAPFLGDEFNSLLASIEQPAIILMDEFEKVYSEQEAQEQILTLLDGVMTSKKLFVLTVNDKYRVNDHMKNRPGRIYYHIEFDGLEPDFVREYCQDNLDDKDQIENIVRIGVLFKAFNFDMLKAIVEEMNRYKEDAFDALELLNAKPISTGGTGHYEVVGVTSSGFVSKAGRTNELPMDSRNNATGVVLAWDKPGSKADLRKLYVDLGFDAQDADDFDADDLSNHFAVFSKNVRRIDADRGVFEFTVGNAGAPEVTMTFTKKYESGYNLRDLDY